jgi:hypothetical protein
MICDFIYTLCFSWCMWMNIVTTLGMNNIKVISVEYHDSIEIIREQNLILMQINVKSLCY